MNARQCPDDLLVAARNRWLSDLERQAVSAHLARCETCCAGELAAELLRGPLFAGGATPDADQALVDRVAERASASLARSALPPHPGWRRVAVAVAVFLGLGGVASAWIGRSWVAPRPVAVAVAVDSTPVPIGSSRRHRAESPPAPLPQQVPSASLPAAKKVVAARPVRDSVVLPAPETASSLFAAAARARHDGDMRRAVALYSALRSSFPESEQARVAAVSMGDLLLRLDEPVPALGAFDAYLSAVRTGPLREEALFGRARCLRALGKETAEAETWARLVRDFPGSAYGAVAHQRLDQLRGAR